MRVIRYTINISCVTERPNMTKDEYCKRLSTKYLSSRRPQQLLGVMKWDVGCIVRLRAGSKFEYLLQAAWQQAVQCRLAGCPRASPQQFTPDVYNFDR